MTPDEIAIAKALSRVTFIPGTNVKTFSRKMTALAENSPDTLLSEKQSTFLKMIAWKYRRQLPESVVRLGLKPNKVP